MAVQEQFDLVVIGGGKGGKTLAIDLAKQGYKAALIERDPEMIGGTCINVACIPTKTLVQSAKVAAWVRRAGDYGIGAQLTQLEMVALRERKQTVVGFMRGGNYKLFTGTPSLEFILGTARFVDDETVEVRLGEGDAHILAGTHVVVNTGTRPALPAIPGLRDAQPLTNETILEMETLPGHLLVVGGGSEGVEFAQMFRRFGRRVTLIERRDQLLPVEDGDVADAVRQTFKREGIEVLVGTSVERAEPIAGRGARLHLHTTDAPGHRVVEGSHVLSVTGREPVTAELNLAATGLAVDARGFIPVDERLATAVPGIWAVGDVNGGPEFTHVSLDDYRIVKAQITGVGDHTSTADRILTYTVFTDPELGRVGLTETEARRCGYRLRVARLATDTIGMPRAQTTGETEGFLKAVVDAATDRILGTAFYVAVASEMTAVVHHMTPAMPGEGDGACVCATLRPLPSSAVAAPCRSRAWSAPPATGPTEAAARSVAASPVRTRTSSSLRSSCGSRCGSADRAAAVLMRHHAERLRFRRGPSSSAAARRRKRTLPQATRDKGG